ncbi:transmembrane protein 26-like [Anneissia japonica]|uniref:transmembrane protein 26-like n=1 Tax=Anneissia japonica TaxID=1529436 RepID=UPI001425A839|nr:transmembrane protein 26-like [Anneissia japonica]
MSNDIQDNQQKFSPCVLIYILTVIACIWVLEFNLYFQRLEYAEENDIECGTLDITYRNSSISLKYLLLPTVFLDDQEWSMALQQVFVFILIIGRWLLPKGHMTRDQLSELLFINIGMGADILEFIIEGMELKAVGCSDDLMVVILIIWSWSLMQFTINLTVNLEQEDRDPSTEDAETSSWLNQCSHHVCCKTGMWATIVTVILQDGPFFIIRVYLISEFNAVSLGMLFFTAKNALILVLQFYRLKLILSERANVANESRSDPESDIGN